ncbi:hypothetical protein [Dysgonomonas sp. Marseille-P4361]|uniref:hypothetical protein n=1 Tax=Dysgonomonas sp. Marseille-P4361 TaxID=2161820 RepID=UPI000D55F91E|nr:hypothetical protein [Dysgonomonas sp. Marseille-P4361]
MKKILFYTLCSFLMLSLFTYCGQKADKKTGEIETQEQTQEQKEKATSYYLKLAEKENKNMPQVYNGGIRLDKLEAVSKNEFKYYYTMTNDPNVSQEEFVRSSKLPLSLGIRESKDKIFETFKKDKMTLIYAYYKMDGSLFAEVVLTPEDYK